MPEETKPPQYTEEACIYTLQVTLTANQPLNAQKVPIDKDSDFILTGINGSSTGAYSLNMLLPSGRKLANAQIKNTNLIGTASQPTAIGPDTIYRAGGIGPAIDLTDTSGAGNTVEIIFSGIRRTKV